MSARRLQPPYAKAIASVLADPATWPRWYGTSADGRHLTIFIAAGGSKAWDWARRENDRRLILVAPGDRDPTEFDWRLIAGHTPAIILPFDTTVDHLERCAIAILRDGADRVLVQFQNGPIRYLNQEAAA